MKIEACEPSGSLCHRLRTVFADKRPLQMAAAAIHLVILLSASLLASPAQAQTTLRVRSADTGYTDSVGHVWSANYGSTGGDPANWARWRSQRYRVVPYLRKR